MTGRCGAAGGPESSATLGDVPEPRVRWYDPSPARRLPLRDRVQVVITTLLLTGLVGLLALGVLQ